MAINDITTIEQCNQLIAITNKATTSNAGNCSNHYSYNYRAVQSSTAAVTNIIITVQCNQLTAITDVTTTEQYNQLQHTQSYSTTHRSILPATQR